MTRSDYPRVRFACMIRMYNAHRAFAAAKEADFDGHDYLRRNAYIRRAFQLVLQLRNPFHAIFLSFAKPPESTGSIVIKGPFVKPRLTRGAGLCAHVTVRHNKVGVYISRNPRFPSSFSLFRRTRDATRRYAPLRLSAGQARKETVRNKGRNKKGSWRKYFDESPGTYEVFFLREFQSARRILCENLRGEMEKTLIRGATPARPSGRAIIRDAWATHTERVPHSRHGTKCPRTAETHSAQWTHLSFIVQKAVKHMGKVCIR